MRFAVIVSRYNQSITEGLLKGALVAFQKRGIKTSSVPVFRVPGAFEIPTVAAKLAKSKAFEASLEVRSGRSAG